MLLITIRLNKISVSKHLKLMHLIAWRRNESLKQRRIASRVFQEVLFRKETREHFLWLPKVWVTGLIFSCRNCLLKTSQIAHTLGLEHLKRRRKSKSWYIIKINTMLKRIKVIIKFILHKKSMTKRNSISLLWVSFLLTLDLFILNLGPEVKVQDLKIHNFRAFQNPNKQIRKNWISSPEIQSKETLLNPLLIIKTNTKMRSTMKSDN